MVKHYDAIWFAERLVDVDEIVRVDKEDGDFTTIYLIVNSEPEPLKEVYYDALLATKRFIYLAEEFNSVVQE
jgi:hypothetical protein